MIRDPTPSRLKQVSPAANAAAAAPVSGSAAAAPSARTLLQHLHRCWRWLQLHSKIRVQPKARRLRVSETVSLGEKRFVSIVEVDGNAFLIGGGAGSVCLLTELADRRRSDPFQQAVADAWQRESA